MAQSPVRIRVSTAAEMLDTSAKTIRRLVAAGVLANLSTGSRGVGRRIYLDPEQVRLFGVGGAAAAAEYAARRWGAKKTGKGKLLPKRSGRP